MKNVISILLFFLLALGLQAQCTSGDCRNGSGTYIYPSGAKYVGQFKNGKISGIGTCYFKNGSVYQGEWENGQPNGQGIKTYKDGRKVSGTWKKGELVRESGGLAKGNFDGSTNARGGCVSGDCQNGIGIYIYPSGAVYTGDFKNGEINGSGVCEYSDGSKYHGQWVNRYPEGLGTRIYADGTSRNGYWKKGRPVDEAGRILENWAQEDSDFTESFDVQSGCIYGNCDNGRGTFAYPNGDKYEGNFLRGRPNGSGTFHYANGEKYIGIFKDGLYHGNGKFYQEHGMTKEGVWENGEYVGTPKKERPSYDGCVSGNCQNGFGTFLFRDGSKYIGTFSQGQPDGQGQVTRANGERYTGDWSLGKYHGEGTLTLQNGSKVSGYWDKDAFVGTEKESDRMRVEPSISHGPKIIGRKPDLKVWAVIIGVASYNHMPLLRYTDDDAYRMYAFLKSPEGGALDDDHIRILIDEDATKDNIKNTMVDIFGKAGPNDLVMLYFSGHGLKGSFLPSDFDGFNNKLLHDEINEILSRSPAKYKLCIADACHSGSLLAMKGGQVPNMLSNYYNSLAQASAGTALIMSSKSDETSLESSGLRQGVFSHFLIRGLKGEADMDYDKVVTVQELYNYVSSRVKSYTSNRQSPLIQGDYDPEMTVAVQREK